MLTFFFNQKTPNFQPGTWPSITRTALPRLRHNYVLHGLSHSQRNLSGIVKWQLLGAPP